jgi:antitoxin component YwqK of YwqJK toxin-antitoxin module
MLFYLEYDMKPVHLLSSLILLLFMTACQSNCSNCDEVVCEAVHRYGVPLEPDDWSARGQDGQIISMRKDGVTVARTYDGGVLNGESSYSFPHRDVIQRKEIYNQGVIECECTHYPNGLPQQQITYQSPTQQSTTIWYENGAPQAHEEFVNERLVRGAYYDINHQIESKVDESNGLRTCRDGLGQLQSMDTIENGQMILRTTYHPNGIPSAYTPYVNDMIEGQRRTFQTGGEPATLEEWTHDVQHGNTTVFEYGEKWADVPYVNGRRQGIEYRYRDGQTAQEVNWVQDQQHGPSYSYINGTTQTDWYFRGRQVPNKATFDMLSNQ